MAELVVEVCFAYQPLLEWLRLESKGNGVFLGKRRDQGGEVEEPSL
jgi:hypothetical protein